MSRSRAFVRRIVSPGFLIGVVVVGLLVVLVAIGIGRTRCAMLINGCTCHGKVLGLALQNYHDEHGTFPPAYIADADGKPMHSWRVLILPYLEEQELYAKYRFDQPWNGPHNRELAKRHQLSQYVCPAADGTSGETSYVAVVGPETMWPGAKGKHIDDIRDGTSKTIAIIETANSGIHWMEPRDLTLDEALRGVNSAKRPCISSHHPSGANVIWGDAHVSFLPNGLPPETLRELLTASGREHAESSPPRSQRMDTEQPQATTPGSPAVVTCIVPFIVFLAIVVLLAIPAFQVAHEPSRKYNCINNLKQFGIALHNYAEVHRAIPPAYVVDEDGRRTHSWCRVLLPFFEEEGLRGLYNPKKTWDNQVPAVIETCIPSFSCPRSELPVGHTTYVAVVGPDTAWPGGQALDIDQITDGLADTIAVVEIAAPGVPWADPSDLTFKHHGITRSKVPTASPARTAVASTCYSSTATSSSCRTTRRATLRALLTANGGEKMKKTYLSPHEVRTELVTNDGEDDLDRLQQE